MNRSWIKLSLLMVAALAIGPAAFGQGWPLPAKTPNTPVACPASSLACSGKEGKLTAPYSDPIKTFVGRYLDSSGTREWQPGFRTGRARVVGVDQQRNRIYMIVGSALFMYDMDKFVSRLASGEAMVPSTVFGAQDSSGPRKNPETFLLPDAWFYAEKAPPCQANPLPIPHTPVGCWINDLVDGQDRLFGFDWDDRGYVYVAYNPYGWGIIQDQGSGAQSMWQGMAGDITGAVTPNRVVSVKSNGGYYLIVSPDTGTLSNVFYVGDASTVAHERRTDIRHTITSFAKSTDGHIGAVEGDGRVHIYTNDGIIAGIDVLDVAPPSGTFYSIDTDGTNFYAATRAPGQNAQLVILTNNGGNSYTKTVVDLGRGYDDSPRVHWGPGGFILIFGSEGYAPGTDTAAARNLRLYRLTGTSLTPIPLLSGAAQPDGTSSRQYFANYYHQNSATNYTTPSFTGLDGAANPPNDARLFKVGSKTYLIVAACGLGDVYEIGAGDSIAAKVKSVGHSANPKAAGTAAPGPFYGDEITFTSTSSSANPPSVFWQFDGDNAQYPRSPVAPDIPYQFGNLTNASFVNGAVTRSATVRIDSNTSDSTTVQIKAPQIRLGISGRPELLFTQPDVSSSAPIVTSDQWVDESDGAMESHFNDWNLDGSTVQKVPDQAISVGGCGSHTLIFTTHYGPNLAQNNPPSFTMVNTEATYSINPYKYTVAPYTITVADPIKDPGNATNILFTASIRTTSSTTDLPALGSTAATYTWSLLNADGSPAGVSQTTQGTLANPTGFSIPKASFGSTAKQVRLQVDISPSATTCTSLASQTRVKPNLTGPTGTITINGCTSLGSPCSFTFGTPNAAWHYSWSATGAGNVIPSSGDGATFATYTPLFSAQGSYTIAVTVENAIGIFTAVPVNITLGAPVCASAPTTANTIAGYYNDSQTCLGFADTCKTGDTIHFYVQTIGYHTDTCDTYDWDFGDGSQHSNLATPTHVYNNVGNYTITLVYHGGLSDATVTNTIKFGTVSNPPPGGGTGNPPGGGTGNPPPNNPNCGTLDANSMEIGFSGAVSGCTPVFGVCKTGEGMAFYAVPKTGYSLSCATHTYSWNFGDNASSGTNTSTDANPVHLYNNAGTYTVSMFISNGVGSSTITKQITIGGTGNPGNPPPTTCPALTAATIAPAYSSANASCHSGGTCGVNEPISFHVDTIGNAAGCAITGYTWVFGNGDSATSSSATPTFTFGVPGDHTVSVSVTNAQTSSPVTVTFSVHVGAVIGNCPEMTKQNVYLGWYGETTGCTPVYGECTNTELVGFQMYGSGYQFTCSTHTFSWDWDDGSPVDVIEGNPGTKHKFKFGGTFDVTVTITNAAGGSYTLTEKVKVQGPPANSRKRSARH